MTRLLQLANHINGPDRFCISGLEFGQSHWSREPELWLWALKTHEIVIRLEDGMICVYRRDRT